MTPQAGVELVKVQQSHQHQAAGRAQLIALQGFAQVGQKVFAAGQAGHGIAVDFLPQHFEPRGFFTEHGFEPADHLVHRTRYASELGGARFLNGQEATLGDGLRLVHDATQRPGDDANQKRAAEACDHATDHKPEQQFERAFP